MKLDIKSTVGVVGAVIVVIFIVIAVFMRTPGNVSTHNEPISAETTRAPVVAVTSMTRETVPENILVPEKNSANVSRNVAVPQVVSRGSSSDDSSYRSFDIKIASGHFTPDTVIVNMWDTTNINITAVDANYGFTQPDYGIGGTVAKDLIKKGTTKKIQFNASASGKFMFYCASCGGPSKGPVGYLIVVQK